MEYLDISKMKFIKESDDSLLCVEYDGTLYKNIKIIRCFPKTNPDHYLEIRKDDNSELGIIENLSGLSEEQAKLVNDDLAIRYCIPEILRITKRTGRRRFMVFICETSLGKKEIKVDSDLTFNVSVYNNDDLLLKDVDGAYYIIKNYKDRKDRQIKFIESYI